MKNKKVAFALLDSSYRIPQHLQMLAFNNYAKNNEVELAFYGGELVGQEETHLLFLSYLNANIYTEFLFFSVRQFLNSQNKLQKDTIAMAIEMGKALHFANENRIIRDLGDLKTLSLLTMSIDSQLWKNRSHDLTLETRVS